MARNAIVPILLGAAGLGAVSIALAAAGSGSSSEPIAKPSGKVTPKEAANLLLMYLQHPSGAASWGSKDAPNKIIAGAQADMGELVADGIYGPKTKARGEALTQKAWPDRPASAASTTKKPAAAAAKKPTAAAAAKAPSSSSSSASIPSNKVTVTTGPITSTSVQPKPSAASSSKSATVMTAPQPTPPPGGSAAQVVPTERSPKAAAQALYTYATQLIRQGRGAELGSKDKPNNTVAACQRDMKKLSSDGIYGPKTQARGKELIGMEFPSRYGTGTKIAAAQPPSPPLTTANEQENRQRAAEGLLAYLQKPGADQGAKGKPSAFVRASQQQMGGLTADGIYGPATRTRGTQLINKPFPPRK